MAGNQPAPMHTPCQLLQKETFAESKGLLRGHATLCREWPNGPLVLACRKNLVFKCKVHTFARASSSDHNQRSRWFSRSVRLIRFGRRLWLVRFAWSIRRLWLVRPFRLNGPLWPFGLFGPFGVDRFFRPFWLLRFFGFSRFGDGFLRPGGGRPRIASAVTSRFQFRFDRARRNIRNIGVRNPGWRRLGGALSHRPHVRHRRLKRGRRLTVRRCRRRLKWRFARRLRWCGIERAIHGHVAWGRFGIFLEDDRGRRRMIQNMLPTYFRRHRSACNRTSLRCPSFAGFVGRLTGPG